MVIRSPYVVGAEATRMSMSLPAILNPDTAVLGKTLLGDVEPGLES